MFREILSQSLGQQDTMDEWAVSTPTKKIKDYISPINKAVAYLNNSAAVSLPLAGLSAWWDQPVPESLFKIIW